VRNIFNRLTRPALLTRVTGIFDPFNLGQTSVSVVGPLMLEVPLLAESLDEQPVGTTMFSRLEIYSRHLILGMIRGIILFANCSAMRKRWTL
jgi:hypothetical protein